MVGTSATAKEQLNQIDSMLKQQNVHDSNYDSDYGDLDENCVAVISDSDSLREVETVNMQIYFGNKETKAFVSLERLHYIYLKPNKRVDNEQQRESLDRALAFQDLKSFSKDLIKSTSVINTTVNVTIV